MARLIAPRGYFLEAGDADEASVPDAWDRLTVEPEAFEETGRVPDLGEARDRLNGEALTELRDFLLSFLVEDVARQGSGK